MDRYFLSDPASAPGLTGHGIKTVHAQLMLNASLSHIMHGIDQS